MKLPEQSSREKSAPNLYTWIITSFQINKTPIHAAHVCFFILVSFFPFVAFLTKIISYTPIIDRDMIRNILEQNELGSIGRTILSWITDIQTSSDGLVIFLSILILIWTGSKGVDGLAQGMDAIYGTTAQKRGYVRRRLTSVLYLIATVILIVLFMVLLAFGKEITDMLLSWFSVLQSFNWLFALLRYMIAALSAIAFFVLVFRFLPYMPTETKEERKQRVLHNRKLAKKDRIKKPRIRTIKTEIPGALLTSLMWIIFSRLYGIYMSYQMSHPTIYGGLTGFFLTLLWLYYCMIFTFIGALFNNYYYKNGEPAVRHILKDIPDFLRLTWEKLPFNRKTHGSV